MGSRRSPANWTERGRLKRSVPGLRDKVYRLHLYRLEAPTTHPMFELEFWFFKKIGFLPEFR